MKLFHFKHEVTKRALFTSGETTIPLEVAVVMGKRHVVGVGELGNKGVTVEKTIMPFGKKLEIEDVAKEVLQKLGVPQSEWDKILSSKKEITV